MALPIQRPLYYRARGNIEMVWRSHITPTQERVISWLVYTTFAWVRTPGCFSVDEMLAGKRKREKPDEWAVQPINLARSTLRLALQRLRTIGLVSVRTDRGITKYMVNVDWRPAQSPAVAGRLPQRNSSTDQPNSSPSKTEIRPVYEESSRNIKKHSTGQSPNGAGYDASLPGRSTAVQEKQNQSLSPDQVTLEEIWFRAFRETWPQAVVGPLKWTKRDQYLVRGMLGRWDRVAHGEFRDFLDFAVRNWWRVISRSFGWMKDRPPPTTPQLPFLNRFLNEFTAAFADRTMDAFLASEPEQRALYWRLLKAGKSSEEALLEIATQRAVAVDRDQREADRREAARLYRMAHLARKQAEQPRWSKANPHPDAVSRTKPALSVEDHFESEAPYVPPEMPPWKDDPEPGVATIRVRHRARQPTKR